MIRRPERAIAPAGFVVSAQDRDSALPGLVTAPAGDEISAPAQPISRLGAIVSAAHGPMGPGVPAADPADLISFPRRHRAETRAASPRLS